MKTDEPEIYFHVGLGKVASTYLQKKVFPFLEGITYIPSSSYRRSKTIIKRAKGSKFLVSREFDKQYEDEINWFLESFSNVKIIVFFRRHDSWITSQYKRFVKNGWYRDFDQFFNLENGDSYWKKEDLIFEKKIDLARKKTGHEPLVVIHDQLLDNPYEVVKKIATFTETKFKKKNISTTPVHTSYSEKQLKFLRMFTTGFFRTFPKDHNENKWKHWLFFRPWWLLYHLILYVGALIPPGLLSKIPLISPQKLNDIAQFFEEDWKIVRQAAEKK